MEQGRSVRYAVIADDSQGEAMLERLRQTLVESYVGAVALGWLLAGGLMDFVGIFSPPVAVWVSRNQLQVFTEHTTGPGGLRLQDGLPELIKAFVILLIWYVLFRWLYFKPLKIGSSEPKANPE
jgi:hypothetical protein